MRLWYIVTILLVLSICTGLAQQSIYFPLVGTTKDTPRVISSLVKPSNGDPFKPFEFSLVEAIIARNPGLKSYVDSVFIANSNMLPFIVKRSRIMENQIHGLIVNFEIKQNGSEFVSQVVSIQPVMHFKFDSDREVVIDTLPSIDGINYCAEPDYSYLLNTVHPTTENLLLVNYLRSVYDGEDSIGLLDGKFQSQTYEQFRSKDTKIDTSVIFSYNYEERILIDTTIFKWADHKPILVSQIHFCPDSLSISLDHAYIGLAREAIDKDTEEFKYYWPVLYIRNRKLE